jgi:hypothetical protein
VPVHSFPLHDAVPVALASIFVERKAFRAATHWDRSLALTKLPSQKSAPVEAWHCVVQSFASWLRQVS